MNICKWVYHFGANQNDNDNDIISILPLSNNNSHSDVGPIDLELYLETYY